MSDQNVVLKGELLESQSFVNVLTMVASRDDIDGGDLYMGLSDMLYYIMEAQKKHTKMRKNAMKEYGEWDSEKKIWDTPSSEAKAKDLDLELERLSNLDIDLPIPKISCKLNDFKNLATQEVITCTKCNKEFQHEKKSNVPSAHLAMLMPVLNIERG